MKHVKKRYIALTLVLMVGLWSFNSPQNDKYFLIIKNLDIFYQAGTSKMVTLSSTILRGDTSMCSSIFSLLL